MVRDEIELAINGESMLSAYPLEHRMTVFVLLAGCADQGV